MIRGHKLLKSEGFYLTFEIIPYKNAMKLRNFFSKLNRNSYYNAFYRVKNQLIKKGFIEIFDVNGIRMIKLTQKGLRTKLKLEMLMNQMR